MKGVSKPKKSERLRKKKTIKFNSCRSGKARSLDKGGSKGMIRPVARLDWGG